MGGLSAGDLDREIVLQTAARLQSDSGEVTFDWANAVAETLWAAWVPGSTREGFLAQRQIGSHIDGAYRVYHRADVVPDACRIAPGHDGRIYDIRGVTELGRGDGLLLAVVARGEAA